MACGLFGKLPSKRDFVSHNMLRPFSERWENWLQSGLAESRLLLAERWQDLFLTMPIWRFWAGAGVFGQAVTGAMMPSVDGVGRYFPLTLVAVEPSGQRLTIPPSGDLDIWHDSCEATLLEMLSDGFAGDLPSILRDFPFAPVTEGTQTEYRGKFPNWVSSHQTLVDGFASLAESDAAATNKGRALWWTLGGHEHSPRLLVTHGSASASLFTNLVSGQLG